MLRPHFTIQMKLRDAAKKFFKDGLIWEFYHQREDNNQEVCRIYIQLENIDWHNQNQWPEINDFFIKNMLQMEYNFLMVKEVVKEELRNQE